MNYVFIITVQYSRWNQCEPTYSYAEPDFSACFTTYESCLKYIEKHLTRFLKKAPTQIRDDCWEMSHDEDGLFIHKLKVEE